MKQTRYEKFSRRASLLTAISSLRGGWDQLEAGQTPPEGRRYLRAIADCVPSYERFDVYKASSAVIGGARVCVFTGRKGGRQFVALGSNVKEAAAAASLIQACQSGYSLSKLCNRLNLYWSDHSVVDRRAMLKGLMGNQRTLIKLADVVHKSAGSVWRWDAGQGIPNLDEELEGWFQQYLDFEAAPSRDTYLLFCQAYQQACRKEVTTLSETEYLVLFPSWMDDLIHVSSLVEGLVGVYDGDVVKRAAVAFSLSEDLIWPSSHIVDIGVVDPVPCA